MHGENLKLASISIYYDFLKKCVMLFPCPWSSICCGLRF